MHASRGGPVPAETTETGSTLESLLELLKLMEKQQGENHVRTVLTHLLDTRYAQKNLSFAETYDVALNALLGNGGYGIVKLATHKTTRNQVAVKIISKTNDRLSPEDIAGLQFEAELLRELDHPHIIKCYATFDEPETFYMVTELVEGGDLFDRVIRKKNYNEKEARDLIKLFLEIMVYMHDTAKVVHRDLKLENILLTSNNDDANIKLCDFGMAKKEQDLFKDGQERTCGTHSYTAPEIFRSDRYGCEVDIWSMGVIAYLLLSGMPPFYENKANRTYPRMLKSYILRGQYSFPPERWDAISQEAKDMITHMLCVNQSERWTASQLLTHPWILMGEEVLQNRDLSASVASLKKYRAKMQFRKIAHTVIAARRMQQCCGKTSGSHTTKASRSHPSGILVRESRYQSPLIAGPLYI